MNGILPAQKAFSARVQLICLALMQGYTNTNWLSVSFSHPCAVCQVWFCRLQLPKAHLPSSGGPANHTIIRQSGQHRDKGKIDVNERTTHGSFS